MDCNIVRIENGRKELSPGSWMPFNIGSESLFQKPSKSFRFCNGLVMVG